MSNSQKFKKILLGVLAATIALTAANAQETRRERSINDLEFLIGDWEGTATNFHASRPGRDPTIETMTRSCAFILKDTYIRCLDTMTRSDGRNRTISVHFNYNNRRNRYQSLYVYDDWHRHLSYLMVARSRHSFTGLLNLDEEDHGTGFERINWNISEDGKEFRQSEFVQAEPEAERSWIKGFEFVVRKVE